VDIYPNTLHSDWTSTRDLQQILMRRQSMTEIFILAKDDRFPRLVQDDSDRALTVENDFALRAGSPEMHGVPFGNDYRPVKLAIAHEDRRKKGISDIHVHFMSFLIFSAAALEAIGDVIEGAGQVLPVDDRYPKLMGFHVTRLVTGAVNFEKSDYVMYEKGPLIRRAVLFREKVAGVNIFKIQEDPTRVFVSSYFEERVKNAKLKGFSFARKIELS
jgi:uncharacterized protein DUF1629